MESYGIIWNHMESMETYGINGIRWNQWNHMESTKSHEIKRNHMESADSAELESGGISWNQLESMESWNHGISFFPLG